MAARYDVTPADHGSIVVLHMWTPAAKAWATDHLPEDCPTFGRNGYAIERRYVGPILDGLQADGLTLEPR